MKKGLFLLMFLCSCAHISQKKIPYCSTVISDFYSLRNNEVEALVRPISLDLGFILMTIEEDTGARHVLCLMLKNVADQIGIERACAVPGDMNEVCKAGGKEGELVGDDLMYYGTAFVPPPEKIEASTTKD